MFLLKFGCIYAVIKVGKHITINEYFGIKEDVKRDIETVFQDLFLCNLKTNFNNFGLSSCRIEMGKNKTHCVG